MLYSKSVRLAVSVSAGKPPEGLPVDASSKVLRHVNCHRVDTWSYVNHFSFGVKLGSTFGRTFYHSVNEIRLACSSIPSRSIGPGIQSWIVDWLWTWDSNIDFTRYLNTAIRWQLFANARRHSRHLVDLTYSSQDGTHADTVTWLADIRLRSDNSQWINDIDSRPTVILIIKNGRGHDYLNVWILCSRDLIQNRILVIKHSVSNI